MKAKMLICHYCKNKFPADELTQVSKSRRSCKGCIDLKLKESKEYTELIEYICNGFGQTAPDGKQLSDIKKFKNMGYSYLEMQWTIYYIIAVAGKRMDGKLGLIPFYYQQAKEYFANLEKVKKSVENVEETKLDEIVIVKTGKPRNLGVSKTRFVNIENII